MKDRCGDPWVVQSPATDRERQVLAVLVCHSTPVGRFVLTVHPFNRTCNKEFVASRAGKGSRRGKVQHTLGYCWRTLSLCLLPLHAVERAGVRPPPFGFAVSSRDCSMLSLSYEGEGRCKTLDTLIGQRLFQMLSSPTWPAMNKSRLRLPHSPRTAWPPRRSKASRSPETPSSTCCRRALRSSRQCRAPSTRSA